MVAVLMGSVIFLLWYPDPFYKLSGGGELFFYNYIGGYFLWSDIDICFVE